MTRPLRKRGQAPTAASERSWTAAERRLLEHSVGRRCPRVVGEELGRSEAEVRRELLRLGLFRAGLFRATLRARDVARATGAGPRTVRRWLTSGLLPAVRRPSVLGTLWWVVYPADLAALLEAHPEEYELAAFPRELDGKPNPWLAYAREVDAAAGFLIPKQAAQLLGLSARAVRGYCQAGRLGAARAAPRQGLSRRQWLVPSERVRRMVEPEGVRVFPPP